MSFLQPNHPTIDLGINIDHVATLRNARGTAYPDPIQAALLAEQAGADAITLHLREDRRHIKDADVEAIRPLLATRMNLESAVTAEMLDFACRIQPQDVCLVPERRAEVTTEGGLDVVRFFPQVPMPIARASSKKNYYVSMRVSQQASSAGSKSMPGTDCITPTYKRLPPYPTSPSSTSGMPSLPTPCLWAGKRRCAR